jgi:hypothetical protein
MTLDISYNDNGFALYYCTCEDFLRYKNTRNMHYKSPTNADALSDHVDVNYFSHQPGFFPCRHIYAAMIADGVVKDNPELVPKDMPIRSLAIAPPPASPIGFNGYGATDREPAPEQTGEFTLGQ